MLKSTPVSMALYYVNLTIGKYKNVSAQNQSLRCFLDSLQNMLARQGLLWKSSPEVV